MQKISPARLRGGKYDHLDNINIEQSLVKTLKESDLSKLALDTGEFTVSVR